MSKESLSVGEGTGVAGRYAGLPDPYGLEEFAKVVLLPVPFDETTTYQKGSDKGPEALIEASRNMELYDIETRSEVYQLGIYTAPAVKAKNSQDVLEETYQETKKFLNKDKFVVVLGGEHAISYAPIRAVSEKYGKLTVLQFDAHADLHPAYEGDPLSHASVMARVKELPNVERVVAVGIRSMSKDEVPYQDVENTFFAHEIADNEKWIDDLLDSLSGTVYVTFDLDVFDSSLMPSTGTPEPGGLFWNTVMKVLKRVFKEKNVIGLDVVELLPRSSDPAPDFLAAKLVYKLLSYKFCM